jgi:hypothetical protein
MFETSETTEEVIEKSPWQAYVLAFAIGCFVTFLVFYFVLIPGARRSAAASAEKAAQQRFAAELAKNPLEAQLLSATAALQAATQQSDQCKARFNRQTILYDNTIPIDPGKVWIIPADVEPIATGDHHVTYTHYDPNTKTETVHFYPKRQ